MTGGLRTVAVARAVLRVGSLAYFVHLLPGVLASFAAGSPGMGASEIAFASVLLAGSMIAARHLATNVEMIELPAVLTGLWCAAAATWHGVHAAAVALSSGVGAGFPDSRRYDAALGALSAVLAAVLLVAPALVRRRRLPATRVSG